MPPRFAYWTILLEGAPTAFRASTPEELLPTLKQLQARHPDAVMKWFARGQYWESPEAARPPARPRLGGRWSAKGTARPMGRRSTSRRPSPPQRGGKKPGSRRK